jgi:hypothetical protein
VRHGTSTLSSNDIHSWKLFHIFPVVVALFLSCALIGSCSSHSTQKSEGYAKPAQFDYQDEAGFTRVNVISVARWEDVAASLTPNFNLTADDAQKAVGLPGRNESENITSKLSGSLTFSGIGAAASSGAPIAQSGKSKKTTSSSSGGKASASAEASPDASAKPSAASTSAQGGGPTDSANAGPTPAIDAMSRYQLAAALYQEVQLLNTYVKSVARTKDATPYLVSLDVSIFPSTPKAALNALVITSFVGINQDEHATTDFAWAPDVLPVILSEDIETNVHQRQIEDALLLSLTASGTYGPASGTANITRTLDRIAHLSGLDVNTLQLVSSSGKSSLIVRFGAAYGVKTEYSLYPQTRRIHCLVLVPNDRLPLLQPKGAKNPSSGVTYPPTALFVLSNATFQYVDNYRTFWGIPYGSKIPTIPVRHGQNKDELDYHTIEGDTSRNLRPIEASESPLNAYWDAWSTRNAEGFAKATDSSSVLWSEMAKISLKSQWSTSLVALPDDGQNEDKDLSVNHTFVAFQRWLAGSVDDSSYHPQLSVRLPIEHLSAEPSCWYLTLLSTDNRTLVSVMPDTITPATSSTYEFDFNDLANTALIGDRGTADLYYDPRCSPETDPNTPRPPIKYGLMIASEPKPLSAPKPKSSPKPSTASGGSPAAKSSTAGGLQSAGGAAKSPAPSAGPTRSMHKKNL